MKDKREKKDNVKKGCVFEESRASAREMKKLGDKVLVTLSPKISLYRLLTIKWKEGGSRGAPPPCELSLSSAVELLAKK